MKEIPGYPGYAAGVDGHVYSAYTGYSTPLYEHVVKGYAHVKVRVGGRVLKHPVHRLVLLAFVGPRPDGHVCRHLNGKPLDNRLSNLAWGTHAENAQDAVLHGTVGKGMLAHHRKLTDAQVREVVRRVQAGESDASVASAFGLSRHYPTKLAQGGRWGHLHAHLA